MYINDLLQRISKLQLQTFFTVFLVVRVLSGPSSFFRMFQNFKGCAFARARMNFVEVLALLQNSAYRTFLKALAAHVL